MEPPHGSGETTRTVPPDLTIAAHIEYEKPPLDRISDQPAPRITSMRSIAFTICAILLIFFAWMAQRALNAQLYVEGAGLAALAMLGWLALLWLEIGAPRGGLLRRGPRVVGHGIARPLARPVSRALAMRALIAAAALVLSAATFFLTAGNTFTAPGVATWFLSISLWLVAAAERSPDRLAHDGAARLRSFRLRPALPSNQSRLLIILATLLTGAALILRLHRLDIAPAEMTFDHVWKLVDAYAVSTGTHHVFFTHNAGREAIQFYLLPIVAQVFGTGYTFTTLKLATSLEGAALIPLFILFAREVVDRETGFYGAALIGISWWNLMLSRLGLRLVLTPLILIPILICLIRGIRTGSRRAWLWAGVWMGVGVYGYQALRIAPLAALAAFGVASAGPAIRALAAAVRRTDDAPQRRGYAVQVTRRQALNLLCAGLIALAIFVPMLRVWHDYPYDMWQRVINRTTENEREYQASPASVLAANMGRALLMFNVRGDRSWFTAVPHAPLLDEITGALFMLGVVAWLFRLAVRRDPVDAFVILAGVIMLLPSALALAFPNENPHAGRASGVIPVAFLLAAWPLALTRQHWTALLGRRWGGAASGLLIAALLALSLLANYQRFFVQYDASYRRRAPNPGEVADRLEALIGEETSLEGVWLIQRWPPWHDGRAIGIEAGDITFNQWILGPSRLVTALGDHPELFEARPLVFIVHPGDATVLHVLRAYFPRGEAHLFRSPTPERDFILYVVRER